MELRKNYLKNMYDMQAEFKTEAEQWYECNDPLWNYLHNSRRRKIERMINSICEATRIYNVLDIGCAEGNYVEYLQELNPAIFICGVDISIVRLRRAKSKSVNVDFVLCDAEALPFKSKCFDLTICSEVIEHVLSPIALLHEIKRVNKKFIILSTPSKHCVIERRFSSRNIPLLSWNRDLDSILSSVKRGISGGSMSKAPTNDMLAELRKFESRYEHLYLFDQDELLSLLKNTGFKIHKLAHSSFYLPFLPMRLLVKIGLVNLFEKISFLRKYLWCMIFLLQ
jgi:ubiquinone/menaquinone biosynthesis C-methylase UbiE